MNVNREPKPNGAIVLANLLAGYRKDEWRSAPAVD
jgi:hypothetical protein